MLSCSSRFAGHGREGACVRDSRKMAEIIELVAHASACARQWFCVLVAVLDAAKARMDIGREELRVYSRFTSRSGIISK